MDQYDLFDVLFKVLLIFYSSIFVFFLINYYKQIKNMSFDNKMILSKAMVTWTKQRGHPVVTVHKINKTHISLSQHRFVLDSTFKLDKLKE